MRLESLSLIRNLVPVVSIAVAHDLLQSCGDLSTQGLQDLRDGVGLLQRKATPEELEDYKRFVLNLATTRVANAHREGGVSVSPAERAALEEIAAGLDLPAP